MTTKAQLRKAALRMPETEERTHFGMVAFCVRDRGFASVTGEGEVQLQLPEARVREFLNDHGVGEPLHRKDTLIGLRVPLADVNGMVLNALVRAAWLHRAPRRLAEQLDHAPRRPAGRLDNADPETDDLPAAIGNPAKRALREAGVTSLRQVASWTADQLLDLHGVGPRAVTALTRALVDRGLSLR
ncbi:MAG: hypothetical protein ACRD0P_31900 [Stackebrandtia sp.]